MRPDKKTSNRTPGGDISMVEWTIAVVGALLVAATLTMIALGITGGNGAPPQVALEVQSVKAVPAGFLVAFRAINRGGAVAADVTIEGRLDGTEFATTRIDYLPPGSAREGGLYFRGDPRRGRLELFARGYQDP